MKRYIKAAWTLLVWPAWKLPYPWKGWTPKGYVPMFSRDYYRYCSERAKNK